MIKTLRNRWTLKVFWTILNRKNEISSKYFWTDANAILWNFAGLAAFSNKGLNNAAMMLLDRSSRFTILTMGIFQDSTKLRHPGSRRSLWPNSAQVMPIGNKTSSPLITRSTGLKLFPLVLEREWKNLTQFWNDQAAQVTFVNFSLSQCTIVPRETCSVSHAPRRPQTQQVGFLQDLIKGNGIRYSF